MASIRSDLREQIERLVQEAKTKLKTDIIAMVDKKLVLLEARVEARVNEFRQDITSTLQELEERGAAVHESPEKVWGLLKI